MSHVRRIAVLSLVLLAGCSRKAERTVWEVKVFIVGWLEYAIVLWQSDVPQRKLTNAKIKID